MAEPSPSLSSLLTVGFIFRTAIDRGLLILESEGGNMALRDLAREIITGLRRSRGPFLYPRADRDFRYLDHYIAQFIPREIQPSTSLRYCAARRTCNCTLRLCKPGIDSERLSANKCWTFAIEWDGMFAR